MPTRLFAAIVIACVLLLASLALWFGLPRQSIADGAAIFAIAFVAVMACVIAFARSNAGNLEDVVRHRDRSALRRLVFGAKRSMRPMRRKG